MEGFDWFKIEKLSCPVDTGVSQHSILGPKVFLLYIGNFSNIVISTDTTFYCMYDQASILHDQLELASQLESDL